jgi:signal transduction histidine kinase/ligand-binding sensor domain-containing protein
MPIVLRGEDRRKNSFSCLEKRNFRNLLRRIIPTIRKPLMFAVFLAFCFFAVLAERLPFKVYSTADGLAQDNVNKIVRDSRGFLWFCTGDGLSRFDGYNFKNYMQEQGLPHRNIIDFLETKDGTYLVATNNGISVFNPNGRAYPWNVVDGKLERTSGEPPIFQTYSPPEEVNNKLSKVVLSMAEQGDEIVAGTTHGLFRFVKRGQDWEFERIEFEDYWKGKDIDFNALYTDSRQDLWIAASTAIYWKAKDGGIEKLSDIGGNSIFEDHQGNVWVDSGGWELGIRVFNFVNARPVLMTTFSKKDGLTTSSFSNALAESDDGRIFVASKGILFEYLPGAIENEPKFRPLGSDFVSTGAVDKGGNLWFGTTGKGVWKLSLNSFTSYGKEDGVPGELISSMFINPDNEIYTVGNNNKINHLFDGKIESITPLGFKGRVWGTTFLDFQSSDGEWWLPSKAGLIRYPKVNNFRELSRTPPKRIYTTRDGLFKDVIFNIFEDSRKDIWISAADGVNSLQRWDRKTDKIIPYPNVEGIQPDNGGAVSFGEDSAGDVWVSFFFGGLVRYRNGEFHSFTAKDGIPEGSITDFLSDNQGRFWIATRSRGLFIVDNPNADAPTFTNFSMSQGLLSNETNCLTKDKFGRIYIGTGRGLNRLEPATRNVKIYTQADGLPTNYVSQCRSDKNGVLWFTTTNALTRFVPAMEKSAPPPPVFISEIKINGSPQKISELGETAIQNLALASDQKQIEIGFFALGFSAGDILRYQYKLDGQDWSAPSEQRSVAFNLSPGTYQFSVRAVSADGTTSDNPATVSFRVEYPFWQRWWFLFLSALLVSLILFVIYRRRTENLRKINAALSEAKLAEENLRKAREERLAELQRVRSRIATDLHDDIGSSLTQIAVYSEVARQRESEKATVGEPLDMITSVANELVDTMSDIVWAINPKKDHLQDLTQRMRRFAANVLSAKDIDFDFLVPGAEHDIPLGANIRREVFLIFKETVNNIVKHSEARAAEIVFSIENRLLRISFKDNGKGFDKNAKVNENGNLDWKKFRGGNGLLNMKKRAVDLGGKYEINSKVGQGTVVVLQIPLNQRDDG